MPRFSLNLLWHLIFMAGGVNSCSSSYDVNVADDLNLGCRLVVEFADDERTISDEHTRIIKILAQRALLNRTALKIAMSSITSVDEGTEDERRSSLGQLLNHLKSSGVKVEMFYSSDLYYSFDIYVSVCDLN